MRTYITMKEYEERKDYIDAVIEDHARNCGMKDVTVDRLIEELHLLPVVTLNQEVILLIPKEMLGRI